MKWKKMGLRASHSACATPSSTVMPAARSCSQPRPGDKRIGVGRPYDDACDARFDDGFGARGLLAGVATWFEGYVEGRAFGRDVSSSAVGKSGALRMKIAAACVPAFRDNFAIAYEHGSYERIGFVNPVPPARELNSSAHVFDIGFAVCHGCLLAYASCQGVCRRKEVAACDFRHASADAHDVEIGGRSTRVDLERVGDGCPASLGSRESKLPKSRQYKKP